MKTSGITAALPAQDLGRAKAFYAEKVGLQALGEFTQAVIHVTDVRAAVEEMRGRGVEFEDSEGNLVGVVPA